MSVQDEEIVAEFEEIAAAHGDEHVVMEDEPEAEEEDLEDEEHEEEEDEDED
ncbi:hypothetical protein [Aquidulcibacter sp.]|jgi:hypothetical protein|uniref:hypothetical protein n=1 Tax=Aquidulcibacter sp. TaxID=2052990 RepID=UPI0037BFEE55